MRWKPDLRNIRPRRGFLWLAKHIDGETRWLERAAWVEEFSGTSTGYWPIAWLDEPFESWLAHRGERERDQLIADTEALRERVRTGSDPQAGPPEETYGDTLGLNSRIFGHPLGPICVCGAQPCRREPEGSCTHSRIVTCFDGASGKSSWACHGCSMAGAGPSPALARQLDEP